MIKINNLQTELESDVCSRREQVNFQDCTRRPVLRREFSQIQCRADRPRHRCSPAPVVPLRIAYTLAYLENVMEFEGMSRVGNSWGKRM